MEQSKQQDKMDELVDEAIKAIWSLPSQSQLRELLTTLMAQTVEADVTPRHYTDEHERGLIYLGHVADHDLYWCPPHLNLSERPTLVARYGDRGDMCRTGMVFGWSPDEPDHPLVVARHLAEARGYDVERDRYAGRVVRVGPGMLAELEGDEPVHPPNSDTGAVRTPSHLKRKQ